MFISPYRFIYNCHSPQSAVVLVRDTKENPLQRIQTENTLISLCIHAVWSE